MYTDSVITDCPELAGYWDPSLTPFLTGRTYQKLKVQTLKVAWFTVKGLEREKERNREGSTEI